jgi:SSS family solute:Na+ symporter
MKLPDGKDITRNSDYGADENDPKVAQIEREHPLGESGASTF